MYQDYALFRELCDKQQQEVALKSKLTGITEGDNPLEHHTTPPPEVRHFSVCILY
jgi:hypothetical protein